MSSPGTPNSQKAFPTSGFASVGKACDFLDLSRATVYRLMDQHELEYAMFGRARRIPWAALHAYAARSMVGNRS